jgi:hypothetical protein
VADWPEVAELAQVLNVDNAEAWETTLERVLSAAITAVKLDVAGTEDAYDEAYDEPTDSQAQAALRMAELLSLRPDAAPADVAGDRTYTRLLKGSRTSFGFA